MRPTCSTTKSVEGSSGRQAMSTGSDSDPTTVSRESRGGPSPVVPSLGAGEADGAALDGDAAGELAGLAGCVSDGVGEHATAANARATTRPSKERATVGC
jgi:hypothetical protein